MTLDSVTAALDAAASALGAELGADGPALVHERETLLGLAPAGTISAGGSCRLVQAEDGWFAMNLARADDIDAVGAWLGRERESPVWDAVVAGAREMRATDAVDRAQLLGIPAAVAIAPDQYHGPTVTVTPEDAPARRPSGTVTTIVDLSALWAGPLCAKLLGATIGARILKVEHINRPDGARAGPPAFWRSLNAMKEERHLDLGAATGRAELSAMLRTARVVVSAARPRALENFGLDPTEFARRGGVWVSITGYGLASSRSDWVAFGDDAAIAGGLGVAAGTPDAPVFAGDAVADPIAGLAGAVVAARLVRAGRAGVVDVAMAGVVNRALNRA